MDDDREASDMLGGASRMSSMTWSISSTSASIETEEALSRLAVVQARSGLPEYLAPGGWVGLRVPAHPVALAVLTAAGGRLLTTSLNRSGEPTVTSEAGARALGLADTVLGDGGQPPSGAASTVLRVGPDTLEMLRAGEITPSALQASLRGTPLADRTLVTR